MTDGALRPARVFEAQSRITVAGHPLACAAADGILEQGGTVADAAVAGAAVLSVVLPDACGLGGDALALVHDAAAGATFGLNASGPAPAAAHATLFDRGVPTTGPLSMTVPGAVAGWHALRLRFGRLPWADLLQPAIRLAREGFPVSPGLAAAIRAARDGLRDDPGCSRLFLAAGEAPRPGERLTQPQLADSLEFIARNGAAAFYADGPARSLVRAVRAAGGVLAARDLAGFEALWQTPPALGFHGHEVRTLPPNSYGLSLLLQLDAIAATATGAEDWFALERFRRLLRAAAAAFDVSDPHIADPAAAAPVAHALDPSRGLARVRALAAQGAGRFVPNTGGTAALVVADRTGNAVSWLQSVMGRFGSMVADPESGIVLNNRMRGFVADPNHPNAIGPGKKPAHSLCPAMVFAGGTLRYALATPGGPGQTVTLAQIIDALVRLDLAPDEAIGRARWAVDRARQPVIEDSAPPALIEALRAAGLAIATEPAGSPFFGSVACIERMKSGTLRGIADPRRETDLLGR